MYPTATSWQNNIMAETIDIAGIGTFFSKLDIDLLTNIEQYFAFNKCIIPWSIGCVTEEVLGSIKINSTHSRCSTCGWALQLPMINVTFRLSLQTFRSSSQTHSSNSLDDIQLFNWGQMFYFFEPLGFCNFPMTKIGKLSPKALPAARPVKACVCYFLSNFYFFIKWQTLKKL